MPESVRSVPYFGSCRLQLGLQVIARAVHFRLNGPGDRSVRLLCLSLFFLLPECHARNSLYHFHILEGSLVDFLLFVAFVHRAMILLILKQDDLSLSG
jgi:hypothetical protein